MPEIPVVFSIQEQVPVRVDDVLNPGIRYLRQDRLTVEIHQDSGRTGVEDRRRVVGQALFRGDFDVRRDVGQHRVQRHELILRLHDITNQRIELAAF